MLIDQQTLRDLEIFRTDDGAPALFDRLDRTATRGGREALRRRYQRPLSDTSAIRSVQASVLFLMEHPDIAELRPDEAMLLPLLRYLDSRYTTTATLSGPRASFEYLTIRLKYKDVYEAAVHGVRTTCYVLRHIGQLAVTLQERDPRGDLGRVAQQLAALLGDDEIARLTQRRVATITGLEALRLDAFARDRCGQRLQRVLELVYEIDAFVSMAAATREKGYSMPALEDVSTLHIEGLRHPFLERAVANDFAVTRQVALVFVTGPNMAGKTTYLKACGCAVFLAHLGMAVPADSMSFAPFQCLFSSLRIVDNLNQGVSYFQAEARRVKAAAELLAAGTRAFVMFDEMFKGTNVKDSIDASERVLHAFARARGSTLIISSHLIELVDSVGRGTAVALRYFDASMRDGVPHFDYRLKEGASSQRLGLAVLEREGVLSILPRISQTDT